jgi:DNA-binding LacI/PurR family transcriptional regulator
MSIAAPRSSKHQRIKERLRKQILDGSLAPGSKLPPDSELFKRFRVNRLTVLQALNGLVREGLIVRRWGDGTYVASRENPPLIPGRHLRIGLLWHCSVLPERLATFFQGAMTRGLLAALGMEQLRPEWPHTREHETTRATWTSIERGVTVECIGEPLTGHQRHPDIEEIRKGRFDALACLSIIEEPWLEQVLALGIPTVLVDFQSERLQSRADQVVVDAMPGYRGAVAHFAAKGHKRIHYLGSYMAIPAPSGDMTLEEVIAFQAGKKRIDPDSYLRLSAYRQAMDECGLSVADDWIHHEWAKPEYLRELARPLAARPADERPQAFICHGYGQAQYLMQAFAELGMWVDCAAACESQSTGPALGIYIDGKRLGEAAAELLTWRLKQPQRMPMRVGVSMLLETDSIKPAAPVAAGK